MYQGSSEISKAYLGSTEVSKIYLGETLVYGSEGSSTLPDGYTQLEYIKSNGGYIDTGYPLQLGDVVELDLWVKSTLDNKVYYGWRRDGTYTDAYQMYGGCVMSYPNAFKPYFYVGAQSTTSYGFFNTESRNSIKVETGSVNNVYANDVLAFSYEGTEPFDDNGSSVYNPCIFTFNALGTPNTSTIADGARCYGYKVTRGSATVIDLIPAMRNSDSVNGFYDIVNNNFLVSPNNVSFTSNLDEVTPLYPISSFIGKVGNHEYRASSDGHFGVKISGTGAKSIWIQDASSNSSSIDSSNVNDRDKLFSISAGDQLVFKVKNISRLGSGNIALNVRTTDNGSIGVSTGTFSTTTDKTVSVTADADYDATGVFLYWASASNRTICLDVELWVNNVRYI